MEITDRILRFIDDSLVDRLNELCFIESKIYRDPTVRFVYRCLHECTITDHKQKYSKNRHTPHPDLDTSGVISYQNDRLFGRKTTNNIRRKYR